MKTIEDFIKELQEFQEKHGKDTGVLLRMTTGWISPKIRENSIRKIRDNMFELSQNQEKRKWLVIFLNKQYIFYHQETIQAFKDAYNKGYTEKEILDNLNDYKITTRAEIKAIKETLIKLERLSDREVSVKNIKISKDLQISDNSIYPMREFLFLCSSS